MKNIQAMQVLGEWQIVMSELMLWFKRTDGLLTLIWPASWILALGLHIAPSAVTGVSYGNTHYHAGQRNLCVLCGEGMYQDCGQAVGRGMPGEELKLASYSRHRRSLTPVVLCHDNAGCNMAQVTVEAN